MRTAPHREGGIHRLLSDFEIGQRHDKNLEIAVAARFEKLSPAVDCEAQKTSEFLSLGDRQLVSWDDIPAGVDVLHRSIPSAETAAT